MKCHIHFITNNTKNIVCCLFNSTLTLNILDSTQSTQKVRIIVSLSRWQKRCPGCTIHTADIIKMETLPDPGIDGTRSNHSSPLKSLDQWELSSASCMWPPGSVATRYISPPPASAVSISSRVTAGCWSWSVEWWMQSSPCPVTVHTSSQCHFIHNGRHVVSHVWRCLEWRVQAPMYQQLVSR